MRTLPHDPYIEAVTDALTAAGLELTDYCRTDDCETRGTYCYLSAVITLDPSGTITSGDEDAKDAAAWPHGLLLLWEWHTGHEAPWEPQRGPVWQFAELKDDGSNQYPTDLPVLGYASPAAVVEAARKVIAREILPGDFFNVGQWRGWDGGVIGDTWERQVELDAACEAWGTEEAAS